MCKFAIPLLALLAFTGSLAAEPETLRISTGEYEPFTGENLPDHGLVNHRVREIATAAGYDLEFHYMPWKRSLEATRQGEFDGSSYWSHSASREDDFIHVGPVLYNPLVFIVRDELPLTDWNDLSDLSGLRVGVVPGYTYTQEFWDLGQSGVLTLSEAPSDEANLKKLLAGRIDVFPTSDLVGQFLMQQNFSAEERGQLRALPTPFDQTEGYLLIPRSLPNAEDLAARLQEIVDNGQIDLTN